MSDFEITRIDRTDPAYPERLEDLGDNAPETLWLAGDAKQLSSEGLAIVGARTSTSYGNHVASELAAGAADVGRVVVSGGAYGIDASAHRGALTSEGDVTTIAVLAGGLDRLFPKGNERLLKK